MPCGELPFARLTGALVTLRSLRHQGAQTMAKLITASQFPNPDAAYEALVDARRGLSDEASAELDAKLVLILANHIGDLAVLEEAIALAKRT